MAHRILVSSLAALFLFLSGASAVAQLRFRITADPLTLDWNLASTSHETYVLMNVMEGLVEEGPDLKPRPALAERWEISPDGKTYTFFLRDGVKWSDGKQLHAADFEASWLRLLDPRTRAAYGRLLYPIEGAEEFHSGRLKSRAEVGIKATGPLTLQVRLKRRVPHFLHLASFWVTFPIRAELIKRHGTGWAIPGKLVTLGPYLLTEWKKGSIIRMRRNPGYYAAKAAEMAAAPEQVEIRIEANDSRARELFGHGKLDVLLNATTQDLLKARAGQGAPRVEQYPYLATYYLGFKLGSGGPLRDLGIRQAIAAAIDRDALPAVLQGGQVAARSWFPPGIDGHGLNSFTSLSLRDARAHLAKAGFPEGQRFPKLVMTVERFDGAEVLARFLSKNIEERLGIPVEYRFPASGESLRSAKTDLFVAHWGADYPDAENFLSVFAKGSGSNYTAWTSPEFDATLARAQASSDAGERLLAYSEAERLLLEKEVAIVPLFYRKNTVLLGGRVQRFSISPLNYLFFKDVAIREIS
ncbi:MAG: peptide ABC transporter substrate-binding protein [Oligoflexia bacterium]|nr:peptide ABC transporter substrate-binding protein [Oligoflexia bacterium]